MSRFLNFFLSVAIFNCDINHKKHFYTRLPDQFLNQVKFNQVNFITAIIVIITNSSIITIINVLKYH